MPRSWRATMKAFAVAALPVAEMFDPPRRSVLTGDDYVIVLGEQIPGYVDVEPESIFAMKPKRATLWLASVPFLPRRRPFIPPWDPSELQE